ncbi:protein pitchfork-like isoform X2 [Pristis pectinata]|uniref:protein pitchfork-like isoform X2 n=1 Tax=Pristis pectinata TaxID=685728 RepID=UPI00223CD665|nr:protein pitchfork-like isoform X2 [Pristis pectinata]
MKILLQQHHRHRASASRKTLPLDVPERKLFPLHWASDRLGNEFPPIRGTPNRGPGCYDTFSQNSMSGNLGKKPESKIGYTLGARTSVRFSPTSISPGPAVHQRRFGRNQGFKPSSAPFGSTSHRSKQSSSSKLQVPGPGTYEPNTPRNRHVTWPMKFDTPDWSLVSAPKKRTLRIELAGDKEFRKHRNRVAYFSLYYT